MLEAISRKKAILFDLFHTLTARESTWSSGLMTSDLLGVTKEQWNEQLLEKSMDRLKGKEKNPFIFVGRMARAINPLIEEEVIRRATEFRVQRMRKAITMIPDSTIQTLQRLKQEGKKLGLLSNADASEILESPIGDP